MKRQGPTWRIPAGILALCIGLAIYGLLVAAIVAPVLSDWHALLQFPVYVALGIVWILPLRRFLIWMETGRWSAPSER